MNAFASLLLLSTILLGTLPVNAKGFTVAGNDGHTQQVMLDVRIVEVKTPPGNLNIYLPSDIRPGDTISGTAMAVPNGKEEAERARNGAEISGYRIGIDFGPDSEDEDVPLMPGVEQYMRDLRFRVPQKVGQSLIDVKILSVDRKLLGTIGVPINNIGTPALGNVPVAGPLFRALGQAGRPVSVYGTFDGNFDNTRLALNGQTTRVAAESPRVSIFYSPSEILGPINFSINDGAQSYTGTYRNIGVNLSAPKLELKKGETTTLTVQVTGLAGIRQDVPIWLVKTGVVSMTGGDYQNYMIRPGDIRSDGTYVTTRGLTGVVAGGFSVTATVVDPTWRPLIIPLILNAPANGFSIRQDGNGARFVADGVRHPITGKPLTGRHTIETACQTPVLSKIPILSTLFKNGRAESEKQECLVFITPRIVVQDENE